MTTHRDFDRLVHDFLAAGEAELPVPIYDAVREQIEHTRQRVFIGPWRNIAVTKLIAYGVAAAAVVAAAIIGFRVLTTQNVGSPTTTPTPITSPTPSASSVIGIVPSGPLEARTYRLTAANTPPFSFTVPADGWRGTGWAGSIETGTFPDAGYTWIVLMAPMHAVSVDPCAGTATTVQAVDEAAAAMTTIAGTKATEPTDTTVGGLPAKVVELTMTEDFACPRESFWLYGEVPELSFYPDARESVIRDWIFERDGTLWFIHTDQLGTDTATRNQVQQIVDSITFG
jgi:hypothetical protein